MNKKYLFLTGFILPIILSGCLSYGTASAQKNKNSAPENKPLPDSLFSPIPSENAQLRVSGHAAVQSFDGIELNWGAGTISAIPAGKHTLTIMDTKYISPHVKLEHDFLPGKCYMVGYDLETERSYHGVTTYIETITGTANLRGYGAAVTAIPGKNESLVEISIKSSLGDDYTHLFMGGYYYKISAYRNDAASSIRFILPAGTYQISSLATVSDINLNVPPNRYIHILIDFTEVSLIKKIDKPLAYIGKWHFNASSGRSISLIFNTDNTGSIGMYNSGALAAGSGAFTYTATETAITIKNPNEPSITMPYHLTVDQNNIYLDNFLGSSSTFMGTR